MTHNINQNEVIILDKDTTYKLTGFVVLILGLLFFLRDTDPVRLNFIGNTSGWTILIVLIGAAILFACFAENGKLVTKAKVKEKN